MASIYVNPDEILEDSFSFQLIDLEDVDWERHVYWYVEGEGDTITFEEEIIQPHASKSLYYVVSNLPPGTTWRAYCDVYKGPSEYSTTIEGEWVQLLNPTPTIAEWDWTESQLKLNAYIAITDMRATTDFNHTVWNALVSKVNEMVSFIGRYWDNSYATYSDTIMYLDKNLTAIRFNSLCINLRNIGADIIDCPETVSKGDKVYGHYFTDITDAINMWIRNHT